MSTSHTIGTLAKTAGINVESIVFGHAETGRYFGRRERAIHDLSICFVFGETLAANVASSYAQITARERLRSPGQSRYGSEVSMKRMSRDRSADHVRNSYVHDPDAANPPGHS